MNYADPTKYPGSRSLYRRWRFNVARSTPLESCDGAELPLVDGLKPVEFVDMDGGHSRPAASLGLRPFQRSALAPQPRHIHPTS